MKCISKQIKIDCLEIDIITGLFSYSIKKQNRYDTLKCISLYFRYKILHSSCIVPIFLFKVKLKNINHLTKSRFAKNEYNSS